MGFVMFAAGILVGGASLLAGVGTGNFMVLAVGVAFALAMLAAASIITHLTNLTATLRQVLEELKTAR